MLIVIRKIALILGLIFTLTLTASAAREPTVSASSAVLIDGDTLEILFEKDAYKTRSMASTTKIMTSLIAVESGRLEQTVTVSKKPFIEGTAIGFEKGDRLTVRDLCYAMLLESGNDAALLTAEFFGKTEKGFSVLMNKKAREIGMKGSNFVTASGLDHEQHYTTAYDMALLGAYAIKNAYFREICSSKTYKAEYIHPEITRYFSNHNRLLSSCEGVIGIKTGFTKKSGRCLVSACERAGKTLVAVTLNAPDDWNDHKKLYDYGFSLYGQAAFDVSLPATIPVRGSDKAFVRPDYEKNIKLTALKGSELSTKTVLNKITYAPVKKQDVLGKIIIYQNGFKIAESIITSAESAGITLNYKAYKPTLFQRLAEYFKNIFSKER